MLTCQIITIKVHFEIEYYMVRLNSEKLIFPVEFFSNPRSDSKWVSNSESVDIKILTWFPGNLVLEILIKICKCVGSTNMRGRFLVKVYLIAIHKCTAILRYFLVKVYLILSKLTQFSPTWNAIFGRLLA